MRTWILILAPLLSGCFFFPEFGHCGYTPESAHWDDPAMWDAVQAEIQSPSGTWLTSDPWIRLSSVTWENGTARVYAGEDQISAHSRGAMSEADLRHATRALLQNATHMGPSQIAAEVEAFIASKQEGGEVHEYRGDVVEVRHVYSYEHHIQLNGTLLLQNLEATPEARWVQAGPAALQFQGATKSTRAGDLLLVVNVWGEVTTSYPWPEGSQDDQVKEHVLDELEVAGLPPPDPAAIEVQGYVC